MNNNIPILFFVPIVAFVSSCTDSSRDIGDQAILKISERAIESVDCFTPSQKNVEASKNRNRKSRDLINSIRSYLAYNNNPDIIINWNYSGNIKFLWGDGLAIDISSLGCSGSDAIESIYCFLSSFYEYFGIDPQNNDIAPVNTTHLKNGSTVYRFVQTHSGYPVRGAEVIVTLDSFGQLTRIYSHFVCGLEIVLENHRSINDVYSSIDRDSLNNSIISAIEKDSVEIINETRFIYVDRKRESFLGIPAVKLTIIDEQSEIYDIIIDATNYEVLLSRLRKLTYEAKQEIWTGVAYPDFTTKTCGIFDACEAGTTCSYDMYPRKCVKKCNSDSDCYSIYPGWKCWTNDGSFPKYCNQEPGTAYHQIHETSGWVSTAYSYHIRYSDVKSKMDDLMYFHYENLGRASWDNDDSDYIMKLTSCCEDDHCDHFNQECIYDAQTAGLGTVHYNLWTQFGIDSPEKKDLVYNTLSHEWAHNIVCSILPDDEWLSNSECLSENIAQIYGSLLSVYHNGGSNIRWTYICGDLVLHRSPWRDKPDGINPGCDTRMPYNQRSRFDWIECEGVTWGDTCLIDSDCPPYEKCAEDQQSEMRCTNGADSHSNEAIWTRFIRVLTEGTSTFDNDGNNEDVGITFSGIGWQNTINVIYDATTQLQVDTSLADWIEILKTSGSSNGVLSEVKKSLGIVGFVADTSYSTAETYSAPNRQYFYSWHDNTNKEFFVWNDAGTYNIKVHYYNGEIWKTDIIDANTDTGPAVAEYNERLYIFWRDKDSDAIRFKYYKKNGDIYGIYNLGGLGISSDCAFDAVEFDDKLYLVYATGSIYKGVYLSKCGNTFCNTSGWHDFGGSTFKKSLGYVIYGSIGIASGSGLNGTESQDDEYLYIASSSYPLQGYRIRIDQVGSDDERKHTAWVSSKYPSYRTKGEIGLTMVESAFPDKKYLYLAWRDISGPGIYKAVVQNYDDTDNSNTWITKSDYTFLDGNTGVRLMRGVNSFILSHTDTAYECRRSRLWGKY